MSKSKDRVLISAEAAQRRLETTADIRIVPGSQLSESGSLFLLSWNIDVRDCGVPEVAARLVATISARMGHVAFPLLARAYREAESFGRVPQTDRWTVRVPWHFRLRTLLNLANLRVPSKVELISTTSIQLVRELQVQVWAMWYEGFLLVTPIQSQFGWPVVAELGGWRPLCNLGNELDEINPICIVIPGHDADEVWIWCSKKRMPQLFDLLDEQCTHLGVHFARVSALEYLTRFPPT